MAVRRSPAPSRRGLLPTRSLSNPSNAASSRAARRTLPTWLRRVQTAATPPARVSLDARPDDGLAVVRKDVAWKSFREAARDRIGCDGSRVAQSELAHQACTMFLDGFMAEG
jgi:hypothetical protein